MTGRRPTAEDHNHDRIERTPSAGSSGGAAACVPPSAPFALMTGVATVCAIGWWDSARSRRGCDGWLHAPQFAAAVYQNAEAGHAAAGGGVGEQGVPCSRCCVQQCDSAEKELLICRTHLAAALEGKVPQQEARAETLPGQCANAGRRVALLDFALAASRLSDGSVPPLGTVRFAVQRTAHSRLVFGPVSAQHGFQTWRRAELATRAIMERAVRGECAKTPSPLFVELGANEGAYGMLAARWGCRTLQVEPQPQCATDLSFAVALSRTLHTGRVINAFVADKNFSLPVRWRQCHGTKQFTDAGVKDKTRGGDPVVKSGFSVDVNTGRPPKTVQSVRVDDIVDEDVLMLKIDVEGAEVGVLRSAAKLLQRRAVRQLLIEFSPYHWQKYSSSREDDVSAVVEALESQRYRCVNTAAVSDSAEDWVEAPPVAVGRAFWSKLAWREKEDVELWCRRG